MANTDHLGPPVQGAEAVEGSGQPTDAQLPQHPDGATDTATDIVPISRTVKGLTGSATQHLKILPEEAQIEVLTWFRENFNASKKLELHKGLAWETVEKSLREDPTTITTIKLMRDKGHEPNVYSPPGFNNEKPSHFLIITASRKNPPSTHGCVYNAIGAEEYARANPYAPTVPNAWDGATELGAELMGENLLGELISEGLIAEEPTWIRNSNSNPPESRSGKAKRAANEVNVSFPLARGLHPRSELLEGGGWRAVRQVKVVG